MLLHELPAAVGTEGASCVPDSGSHQLADLKGSEVLWLNDFEWDKSFIPWPKFKNFLEGSSLKVAVPKTSTSGISQLMRLSRAIELSGRAHA